MDNLFMTKENRTYNAERIVFATNGIGKTGQSYEKNYKLQKHYHTPYFKNVLKMD